MLRNFFVKFWDTVRGRKRRVPEPEVVTLDEEGEESPSRSHPLANGHTLHLSLSAPDPGPSSAKRQRLNSNAAERYVKGQGRLVLSTDSRSRYLERRRRRQFRPANHLSPAVFPTPNSTDADGILSFLSPTPAVRMEEVAESSATPVPLIVELEDEEDEPVILSPLPVSPRRSSRIAAKTPSPRPINGPGEVIDLESESAGPSHRTPIYQLRRQPISPRHGTVSATSASKSGTRKSTRDPPPPSPAIQQGIDLDAKARLRELLRAQGPTPVGRWADAGPSSSAGPSSLYPGSSSGPYGSEAKRRLAKYKGGDDIQRHMNEIRSVLASLEDDSSDSGRPSTSPSPSSQRSGGSVIVLDEDGPVRPPPPPRAPGLSTESLVRMEHSLDIDPKGMISGYPAWQKIRQNRSVDVQNLEKELQLLHKMRLDKRRLADKDLRQRMRLKGIIITDEVPEWSEEEEEVVKGRQLIKLPSDADSVIRTALCSADSEKLVELDNTPICSKDLRTLKGLSWLNDEIINFYLSLVAERGKGESFPTVHAFSTFFYPKLQGTGYSALRRWTKRIDIFSFDILLAPIHLGVHWCLAVVDLRKLEIQYYDSMGGANNECLNLLRDYLASEHEDKKKAPLDVSKYTLRNMQDIPHQKNGSDCGVFTCKFADYIAGDFPITFSQENMPYFRERMIYEIMKKELLP